VTGDESWFIVKFRHSMEWSVSRNDVPQKVKAQIVAQQFVLIVIGCPTSGVSQRAMREAAVHARGVSKARQL
jgi:hypothetical protein